MRLLIGTILIFLIGCSNSVENTIDKYGNSILKLENEDSTCTAFYVGKDLFVTDLHCIRFEEDSWLKLHDKTDDSITKEAFLFAYNQHEDLALIWSYGWDDLRPLEIWNEDIVPPGRNVITMGYPGYMRGVFGIEVGYIIERIAIEDGREFLMAKSMAYPGERDPPL